MKITRSFDPTADRYLWDFKLCLSGEGWAQIDTSQDASYFGNWCNPFKRQFISFCEGDVTETVCDTEDEFVNELRRLAAGCIEIGYGPVLLDPGFNKDAIRALVALGLSDLVYPSTLDLIGDGA